MSEDKPEAANPGEIRPARAGGIGMFWWGIIAGFLVVALVYIKPLLGIARDAFANVMPVFFSPGVLEVSLGIVGFGLVILINYWLLRKEAQDEWVVLPDEED